MCFLYCLIVEEMSLFVKVLFCVGLFSLWLIFLNLLCPENPFPRGEAPREISVWYHIGMKKFYKSTDQIENVRENCRSIRCPKCGKVEVLRRHGYRTGYINNKRAIRCWRLYCDPRGGGCGHTPSLRLCGVLRGRSFSGKVLGLFIEALVMGYSMQSAWDYCKCASSLRTGYRTYHWLRHNESNIRNALYEFIDVRDMNTDASSFIALLELFKKAFKDYNISAFQLKTQKNFGFP